MSNAITEIIEQVGMLVDAGYDMHEIFVNHGNSEWGDNGAVTGDYMAAQRAEWAEEGHDVGTLPALPTAAEWYDAAKI
jgi:hypothetical protein